MMICVQCLLFSFFIQFISIQALKNIVSTITHHSKYHDITRRDIFQINSFAVREDHWSSSEEILPWVRSLQANTSVLMIDGDNLRGKTKFAVSKMQLLQDVEKFIASKLIFCPVYLYFDHGMVQETIKIPSTSTNLFVTFSGPGQSADDIIAGQISNFQRKYERDIILVSEDSGLRKRCKRQSQDSRQNIKRNMKSRINKLPKVTNNTDTNTLLEGTKEPSIILTAKNVLESWNNGLVVVTSPSFLDIFYEKRVNAIEEPASVTGSPSDGSNSSKISDNSEELSLRNRRAIPKITATFSNPAMAITASKQSNIEPVASNSKGSFTNLAVRPKRGIESEDDNLIRKTLEHVQSQLNVLIQLQKIQRKIIEEVDKKGMKTMKKESPSLLQKYQKLSSHMQSLTGLDFNGHDVQQFNAIPVSVVIDGAAKALNDLPLSKRKGLEESWERIILAEQFRLELHRLYDSNISAA